MPKFAVCHAKGAFDKNRYLTHSMETLFHTKIKAFSTWLKCVVPMENAIPFYELPFFHDDYCGGQLYCLASNTLNRLKI